MALVVNMETADQIPELAEPLFQRMVANVEFHPVMSFNDLKKAYQKCHKVIETVIIVVMLKEDGL